LRKARSNPKNKNYRENYEQRQRFVRKLIKKAIENYYKNLFEIHNKNIKKVWKTVNDILEIQTRNVDDVICKSWGETYSVKEIANAFVETFESEVEKKKHNCQIKLTHNNKQKYLISNSMFIPEASDAVINEIILSRSDLRKAPGIDGLNMLDFKAMIGHNISIITKLVNDSFDAAHIPDSWKICYQTCLQGWKAGCF